MARLFSGIISGIIYLEIAIGSSYNAKGIVLQPDPVFQQYEYWEATPYDFDDPNKCDITIYCYPILI
jgi:hypothetical protein